MSWISPYIDEGNHGTHPPNIASPNFARSIRSQAQVYKNGGNELGKIERACGKDVNAGLTESDALYFKDMHDHLTIDYIDSLHNITVIISRT